MYLLTRVNFIGLSVVIVGFVLKTTYSFLLFPQFTLMQVVCCVSWPIPYKDPLRKLYFNVGFQFNYGQPFQVSSFYNPPYWQNAFQNRALPNSMTTRNRTESDTEGSGDDDERDGFTTESLNEYEDQTEKVEERDYDENGREVEREKRSLGGDVTAGQLYEAIEANLVRAGYDQRCLLKAICEMARHPLDRDDDEQLLAEIVYFLLTPSEHQGFSHNEIYEQAKYEAAQQIGTDGGDCDIIYSECENSFLNEITKIVIENEVI